MYSGSPITFVFLYNFITHEVIIDHKSLIVEIKSLTDLRAAEGDVHIESLSSASSSSVKSPLRSLWVAGGVFGIGIMSANFICM